MFSLQTVLVPIDFSPSALAALRHAVELVRPQNGTVLLLHVVNPAANGISEAEAIGGRILARFEHRLENLANGLRAEGGNVEPSVLIGSVEDEILAMANRRGVDLIVIGTHGRSGWGHHLLGSTAERIVRRADCPVLTVKDELAAQRLEIEVEEGKETSE
ncbi:MAG: universal stress protein [Nitrospirae bacterium]|nr:universal stress protein [Nitrospirota bacterium]